MKFTLTIYKPLYTFTLLTLAVFCCAFQFTPQLQDNIVLRYEPGLLAPHEFYVADVIDGRKDKSAIAWLLPVAGKKTGKAIPYLADLQGGTLNGVKKFIALSVKEDKALRPIVITLNNFKITETALPNNTVEGNMNLSLSFALQGDEELIALSDYNTSIVYKRDGQKQEDIEPLLRGMLKKGLIYIDTWMNAQADGNIKLAKTVQLSFADYREEHEGDTLYYSAARPLKWDDFQSKIARSGFEAEVFPTIGYSEQSSVKNSVINLKFSVKVCLPKSACWAKETGKTDAALDHEQRHFDITKIVAEHFKQNLAAKQLPVNNYDGFINVAYLDAYREMNRLQLQYDAETVHGTDRFQQQKWNDKIDKELKEYILKQH